MSSFSRSDKMYPPLIDILFETERLVVRRWRDSSNEPDGGLRRGRCHEMWANPFKPALQGRQRNSNINLPFEWLLQSASKVDFQPEAVIRSRGQDHWSGRLGGRTSWSTSLEYARRGYQVKGGRQTA